MGTLFYMRQAREERKWHSMIVQGQKKLENSKLLTFAQPARMGKNWQLFHSHINHCNLTIIS